MLMCEIALRNPPIIEQLGYTTHGRRKQERFHFDQLWGLHRYDYHGTVQCEGQRIDFAPGDLTLTPPGTSLTWSFPQQAAHHYILFKVVASAEEPLHRIPWHQSWPGHPQELSEAFEAAVHHAEHHSDRVRAWLWNFLWQLLPTAQTQQQLAFGMRCRRPESAQTTLSHADVNPAIQTVLVLIEEELDKHPSLAGFAFRVGLSPNHLNRLFRAYSGTTLMAYIRQRRAELAEQLLTTTQIPIKDVANRIGITDLQGFNKFIRRMLQRSPRQLRDGLKTQASRPS